MQNVIELLLEHKSFELIQLFDSVVLVLGDCVLDSGVHSLLDLLVQIFLHKLDHDVLLNLILDLGQVEVGSQVLAGKL